MLFLLFILEFAFLFFKSCFSFLDKRMVDFEENRSHKSEASLSASRVQVSDKFEKARHFVFLLYFLGEFIFFIFHVFIT